MGLPVVLGGGTYKVLCSKHLSVIKLVIVVSFRIERLIRLESTEGTSLTFRYHFQLIILLSYSETSENVPPLSVCAKVLVLARLLTQFESCTPTVATETDLLSSGWTMVRFSS